MKNRDQSRLASILSLLVGIWVLISPVWIAVSGAAFASVIIVGIVMIVAAAVQFFMVESLPSWIVGIAAAWLFISSFAFDISSAAMYSQVISAILAFLFAFWDGVVISEAQHHHITT